MNVPEGSSRGTRVRLPGDVVRPFDVFLNGVRQEEGADYRIDGRTLVFERELKTEGKLGFWRWLSLWTGIADETRFYFAHSYHPAPSQPDITVGTANYAAPFTCAIARANIFAVQFHPEKSHAAGLRLLANFVAWDGRA